MHHVRACSFSGAWQTQARTEAAQSYATNSAPEVGHYLRCLWLLASFCNECGAAGTSCLSCASQCTRYSCNIMAAPAACFRTLNDSTYACRELQHHIHCMLCCFQIGGAPLTLASGNEVASFLGSIWTASACKTRLEPWLHLTGESTRAFRPCKALSISSAVLVLHVRH